MRGVTAMRYQGDHVAVGAYAKYRKPPAVTIARNTA